MYNTPKRFPAACRFFAQGNCRAGQECHFAHILPLSKPTKNKNGISSDDTGHRPSFSLHTDFNTVQKALRELEMDHLEKKYSKFIQKTIQKDFATIVELVLPLENREDLHVQLIIPYDYPDSSCTIQLQQPNMSSEDKHNIQVAFQDYGWHHEHHQSLVQQLAWLTTHFNSLT
ncbi:hypothetical protein BDF20DRAFT_912054 [Mycotypha africana]|uniref:uncharacterized protein n=1 Tax=Mycotypha africana TaxID=64632 RepID=UPI0022FFFF0B|nr:uncharacterized protein BDF20DRAFT_912054 [Mycotypha africana]KAI8981811.1 hypothetical protein BDF20DRAFT_912054 [Mycotypha africana]